MAMFIMAANCAGIVGGQLFRSDDLPFYHRGWTIAVSFMAFALVMVIGLVIMYAVSNIRIKRTIGASETKDEEGVKNGCESASPKIQLYNY